MFSDILVEALSRQSRSSELETTMEPETTMETTTEMLNLTTSTPELGNGGFADWVVALLALLIVLAALYLIYVNWYYTLVYKNRVSSESENDWHER